MRGLLSASPGQVRKLIRQGEIQGPTTGMCKGYAQGNLVILSKKIAYDFLLFSQRNSKACPVLEVTDQGDREIRELASGSDIATDIPKYRVYKKGELIGEFQDIEDYWADDLVSFILGCSFTFEWALLEAGIEVRHITCGCNVPMYITNIGCKPAGIFSGPLVVSMRPIPINQVVQAVQITARYPSVHGAPVHIGHPASIGIKDLDRPDFGDPVEIKANEIPVFWACGVTPQAVAMQTKPDLMITHSPGHMFITDIKNQELVQL